MRNTVVVSAVRTPIGTIGGTLRDVQPESLLAKVLDGAMAKAHISKELVDEVICGQTKQSADQPNIARLASLMAGMPEATPAYTVHRQCASGMQAILSGVQQIQTGYSDVVLCGGVESMSTAPFYVRNARFGMGSGNQVFVDPNVESQPKSQPNDIYGTFSMIQTADTVAKKYDITREACDAFALESQRRAIAAIDGGRFAEEIAPVTIERRKREPQIFTIDEYPKRDTDEAKMARLPPIFPNGVTTAGNASGRNDGAAALLVMAEDTAHKLGVTPLVRIIGAAASGVDPRIMGIGPVAAVARLEERFLSPQGIRLEDIELIELNEAFAAQALACIKELKLVPERVNVNGGAIALGHPLGCSGARISTTLIHEMKKRGSRYGLATLCVAGGLGMAMAFENI